MNYSSSPSPGGRGRIIHRARSIDDDVRAEVRLLFELLDVVAIGAAEELPVDIADGIAGQIGTVLGELHREAMIGRFMQSGDEALDDKSRDKLHRTKTARDLGAKIVSEF